MANIRIPRKSWVVVCDGSKALFLRNGGDAFSVSLEVIDTLSQPDEKTSDLGTDKPGRAHSPPGTPHSAMEQTDWHAQAEQQFLRGISDRIVELADSAAEHGMILVAPPEALGYLRSCLPENAKSIIRAELAKDYAWMPVPEIERNLSKLAA